MKKVIVVLLAFGLAVATAMARYGVYEVKLSGKTLDAKPDGAKYIHNGEVVDTWPKVFRTGRSIKVIIIDDEELNDQFVFYKDDGEWMQDWAEIDYDLYWNNFMKETSSEDMYKYSEKGLVSLELEIEMGPAYIECHLIGPHAYSEQENGEFQWKYSLNAQGSGIGWLPVDEIEEYSGVAVKSAKIKFNNKRSHQMSDVYYDEYDATEGDEEAAVTAVENWLAEFLGGSISPDLPLDD
jgi:hypothetical protein